MTNADNAGRRVEDHYDALWPLGRKVTPVRGLAPRPATLDGKVVAEVWDRMFYGDVLFPKLRVALRARFPRVRFVDYTHFGNIHGPDERAAVGALPEQFREHKVDAVITGIGN